MRGKIPGGKLGPDGGRPEFRVTLTLRFVGVIERLKHRSDMRFLNL